MIGIHAGRVAVVFGATGWIGRELSRQLVDAGASVVLVARDSRRLDSLARELAKDDRVLALSADVTSPLDVDDVRAAVIARFGRVDLVVVLSGVITGSVFEDGVPADWAEMIDINLRGLLHASQTFTDPLLSSAADGRTADLVLLGSVTTDIHEPRYAVFNATSAAVKQLARTLRDEYGPRGVRVHVVQPGFAQPEAGPDPRANRLHSAVRPEAIASVISLCAALPATANLAESLLLPNGSD